MAARGDAAARGAPAPGRDPVASRARWRRVRRWLLGALAAFSALLALVVLAVWYVGHHLDEPWLKSRLLALSRQQLGFEIDYEGLDVSLASGVRARSFRVRTPPELRRGAEDVVRIEALSLRAPLWRFALGGRSIDALEIGALELALVRDASGRDTLSLLLPPEPEQRAPRAPLSRSLAELPSLALGVLDLQRVSARSIELDADGERSSVVIAPLAVRGSVQLAEGSVAGTDVTLSGSPLRIEIEGAQAARHASVRLELNLRGVEAGALALRLSADLEEQDVAPAFVGTPRLVELFGTLVFDAAAEKTTIALDSLHALGGALSLAARGEVFDGEPLRVLGSADAELTLAALPVPLEGLSLDGLRLRLSAKELSWDGARIGGALDMDGALRRLALASAQGSARLEQVTLAGHGAFAPAGGRFQGKLAAVSLASEAPGASATLEGLSLDLDLGATPAGDAQQLDARAVLALAGLRAALPESTRVELGTARLNTRARGPAAALAARLIPRLESDLSLGALTLTQGARRTLLDPLTASCAVDQLALDTPGALGMSGDASLTLGAPRLRVLEGGAPSLAVTGVALRAEFPLSLGRAGAALEIAALDAPRRTLEGLALDLALDSPLAWGADAPAQATLSGRAARFDAGGARGALEALRVTASQLAGSRYRLALEATGAELTAGGVPLPSPIRAELSADAASAEGTLVARGGLRGQRGARLDLDLDARFERASERLVYRAGLSAQALAAFAAALRQVAPNAQALKLDGARLRASARGDFRGLLRATAGPWPALAEQPLATARGTQSAELELAGLDYRGPRQALAIPKLSIMLDSTHRADGAGSANARLVLPSLELEGGGASLHLDGVEQRLLATFERSPDRGLMLIHSSLGVGQATQSWLPGYPVRDLRFTSDVQVDRLRSIFLRQLAIENPASGTTLEAAGTLELLARAEPGSTRTLAGREALSFEGRLTQALEPFERLGLASHASGTLRVPFRLESGGLLGYRLLAALEAEHVSFAQKEGLRIENAHGVVPVVEEFALLESGPVISAGPRTSPLSDTRFFDVHPFLSESDYVTADSIGFGNLQPFGPVAANVRIDRSDFLIDQLQAGYQKGQIVGQVRVAYRDGDPIVRLRLNATGVRSGKSQEVFDANTSLTFVPRALMLDGKVQIVRASREHVEDILDVLDPFHEAANANRVRRALTLGYPKFVRFQLHDGAVDTKVELGGIAQLVRIDEIKAVPLGPILQKYVAPALAPYLGSTPAKPRADAAPAAEARTPAGGLEDRARARVSLESVSLESESRVKR